MPTAAVEVPVLSKAKARALTDRIQKSTENLMTLIHQAHEGKAWEALGYSSWQAYIDAEFDMSRSHAYRLLTQASVVAELEAAAGLPAGGLSHSETVNGKRRGRKPASTPNAPIVTQAQAQQIAPQLTNVKKRVSRATRGLPDAEKPGVVAEVIDTVIVAPSAPPTLTVVPESTVRGTPKPTPGVDIKIAMVSLISLNASTASLLDATTWGKFETWVAKARKARGKDGHSPTRGAPVAGTDREVEPRFKK